MNTNELTEKLKEIGNMLETGKKLIPEDSIVKFQDTSNGLDKNLEGILQEGRELRLGIVGQVKAGKSSFLNALLFDGQDILPKAPTPMTAALTIISYSDIPKAKVVFYTEDDWNAIVKFADGYNKKMAALYKEYEGNISKMQEKENKKLKFKDGIKVLQNPMSVKKLSKEEFEKLNQYKVPMEYKACKEVFDMAKSLDVGQYLGKEQVIEAAQGDEYGYLRELNKYVGAEGKFTPIVKYTEISLCNELLKGIEVVDTPGMNDPILSRSRTTQKFLIKCDVVFLLSRCSQFLGADDMGFIMSSLPNEGINKAVLIGSMMDSAILEYPLKNNPTFKSAYLGTKRNCEEQARDNINECRESTHNRELLSQIKQSLPPYCISSLAYSVARQMQKGEDLGQYEKKMVDNLCKRFPDFSNDADTLLGLSSILDVRKEIFEETKKQKNQIIQKKITDVVNGKVVEFQGILEDINIQAKDNQNDLRTKDCEQLKKQLENFEEKLDSVRIVVKNLFEDAAVESKWAMNEIVTIVEEKLENFEDIKVVHDTKTEHHSSTSGIFFKKTEHWDETIHTNTAEVNDAYSNIRKYRLDCMKEINTKFRNILNLEKLEKQIKEVVMAAFDRADKDFDEKKIWEPLKIAIKGIILPSFEIGLESYEEELDRELGGIVTNGIVKNENIPLLKRAQDKILGRMSKDIESKIKEQRELISRNLQKEGAEFIDKIVKQLEDNQKRLEELINDKEANLKKLDMFIQNISDAKKTLAGLEG